MLPVIVFPFVVVPLITVASALSRSSGLDWPCWRIATIFSERSTFPLCPRRGRFTLCSEFLIRTDVASEMIATRTLPRDIQARQRNRGLGTSLSSFRAASYAQVPLAVRPLCFTADFSIFRIRSCFASQQS